MFLQALLEVLEREEPVFLQNAISKVSYVAKSFSRETLAPYLNQLMQQLSKVHTYAFLVLPSQHINNESPVIRKHVVFSIADLSLLLSDLDMEQYLKAFTVKQQKVIEVYVQKRKV